MPLLGANSGGGGGSVTDILEPVVPVQLPDIIENNRRCYLGTLVMSWNDINESSKGYRYMMPEENMYVATKDNNDLFITLNLYTVLPYWNRYYSHPLMEDLSNGDYYNPNANLLSKSYKNAKVHVIEEKDWDERKGYYISTTLYAFST